MNNNFVQQSGFKADRPVSIGEWLITFLLLAIPCVGQIMLFVWAFGNGTSITKKNYAKAILIFYLIVFVLCALYVIP